MHEDVLSVIMSFYVICHLKVRRCWLMKQFLVHHEGQSSSIGTATLTCFSLPHIEMQDASSNARKNDWMLQGTSTSINNAVCCQFHHLAMPVIRNFSPCAEVYLMVTQITAVCVYLFLKMHIFLQRPPASPCFISLSCKVWPLTQILSDIL